MFKRTQEEIIESFRSAQNKRIEREKRRAQLLRIEDELKQQKNQLKVNGYTEIKTKYQQFCDEVTEFVNKYKELEDERNMLDIRNTKNRLRRKSDDSRKNRSK